jgi:hypothetical protein
MLADLHLQLGGLLAQLGHLEAERGQPAPAGWRRAAGASAVLDQDILQRAADRLATAVGKLEALVLCMDPELGCAQCRNAANNVELTPGAVRATPSEPVRASGVTSRPVTAENRYSAGVFRPASG